MVIVNADKNCFTAIKANYYKTSLSNFTRGGQRFAASGIIECEVDGVIGQKRLGELIEDNQNQGEQ